MRIERTLADGRTVRVRGRVFSLTQPLPCGGTATATTKLPKRTIREIRRRLATA